MASSIDVVERVAKVMRVLAALAALVVAISPSGCARPGSAVGAIKIGIDTGSPKTVVLMSLTLTSTNTRGSNVIRS